MLNETKELLDAADQFLQVAGGPASTSDVASALTAQGHLQGYEGKDAEKRLYDKMWQEIKRHGDASRWQRVGRGKWCHVAHLTGEMLTTPQVQIRTLDQIREQAEAAGRVRKPKRGPIEFDGSQRCGNCTSLTFYGPHFLTLASGQCDKWPASGVHGAYVRSCQEACPLWQPRTAAQRSSDKAQQEIDRASVDGINGGAAKARSGKRRVTTTEVEYDGE